MILIPNKDIVKRGFPLRARGNCLCRGGNWYYFDQWSRITAKAGFRAIKQSDVMGLRVALRKKP